MRNAVSREKERTGRGDDDVSLARVQRAGNSQKRGRGGDVRRSEKDLVGWGGGGGGGWTLAFGSKQTEVRNPSISMVTGAVSLSFST